MLNRLTIYNSECCVANLYAFAGFEDEVTYHLLSHREVFKYKVDPHNTYYWLEVIVRRKATMEELHQVMQKAKSVVIDVTLERQQKLMLSLFLMRKIKDLYKINLLVGLDGIMGDFLRLQRYGSFDMLLFNNFGYDSHGIESSKQDVIDSLRSATRLVAPNIAQLSKFESVALDSEESVRRFVDEYGRDFFCRVVNNAEYYVGGIHIGSLSKKLQQIVKSQIAAYR